MFLTRCLVVIVFVIIICFWHHSNVCSRCYYLVWELFSCLDYSFWSTSDPRRNLPSDESCTHIQPFIRTHPRKPAGLSRVTSRLSTLCIDTIRHCNVTLPPEWPGRSWCWRPKCQTWPSLASRLFNILLIALPLVAFLCRAWEYSFWSTTTRFEKALVYK